MNTRNRLPLRLLFGVFLAFGLNPQIGRGQREPVVVEPPKVTLIGTTHHIKGWIEKGNWSEGCPSSLTGARLQVVESWYVLTAGQLVMPVDPATGQTDPLSFNNKPFPQGRFLGNVTLTNEKAFDVQWVEPNGASRVPWAKVLNGRTGKTITVYRLLSLKLGMPPNSGAISLDPAPLVMFSGKETSKNVGTIRVDCFFAD